MAFTAGASTGTTSGAGGNFAVTTGRGATMTGGFISLTTGARTLKDHLVMVDNARCSIIFL